MTSDAPYSGHFDGSEHHFAIRIYYEDTDAGGLVYHANYLRFFERARSDMLGLAGIDHVAAAGAGEGHYVVAEAALRYVGSAKLGDALLILSRVEQIRRAACVIQQRVMRGGQLLVEGRLTVAFVGPDGRPRRQPLPWIQAFEAIKGADTEA